MNELVIAALAYIVPSFVIAFGWHMRVFAPRYSALQLYRHDPQPVLGLSSMAIQGVAFAIAYQALIAPLPGGWLLKAAAYAAFGGFLSWSFTTLAVAGKSRMTSVSDYVAIESGFSAVQWIVVGLLTAFLLG